MKQRFEWNVDHSKHPSCGVCMILLFWIGAVVGSLLTSVLLIGV